MLGTFTLRIITQHYRIKKCRGLMAAFGLGRINMEQHSYLTSPSHAMIDVINQS